MTEWKKYDGTDEQIAEMMGAEHGFTVRYSDGAESRVFAKDEHEFHEDMLIFFNKSVSHYLLCNPHPLADMIIRQAQTGQPVWIKEYFKFSVEPTDYKVNRTTTPNWNILGAEYRFAPFED